MRRVRLGWESVHSDGPESGRRNWRPNLPAPRYRCVFPVSPGLGEPIRRRPGPARTAELAKRIWQRVGLEASRFTLVERVQVLPVALEDHAPLHLERRGEHAVVGGEVLEAEHEVLHALIP